MLGFKLLRLNHLVTFVFVVVKAVIVCTFSLKVIWNQNLAVCVVVVVYLVAVVIRVAVTAVNLNTDETKLRLILVQYLLDLIKHLQLQHFPLSDNHSLVFDPALDFFVLSVRAPVQRVLYHLLRPPESLLGPPALHGHGRVLAGRHADLRSGTLTQVCEI